MEAEKRLFSKQIGWYYLEIGQGLIKMLVSYVTSKNEWSRITEFLETFYG